MSQSQDDIDLRQFCLEKAIELAAVNSTADKVLENAKKFYGFIVKNEANVHPIVNHMKKDLK